MSNRYPLKLSFAHFLLAATWALAGTAATASDVLIEHVTVVSPERSVPLRDAEVTIHDDRISEVAAHTAPSGRRPPGMHIMDGRGLYLAPGLIDSHVHLYEIPGMTEEQERAHPQIAQQARAQIPRSYLYFGYTTLVDLASMPQAMARWNSQLLRPDTYFCGSAAMLDGYPMHRVPAAERYRDFPYFLMGTGLMETGPIEPATTTGIKPAEHTPAAVVKRMKADGAICVKTYFERGFGADHNLPVPSLALIRALVREAHAAGLPVLMHANASEAQRFAVDAGVDIIAHGLWNWTEPGTVTELTSGERGLLDAIAAAQTGWQPTIQVLAGLRDLFEPSFLAQPQLARVLPAGLIEWYRTPEGQWFRNEMEQSCRASRLRSALPCYSGAILRDEHALSYLNLHGAHILFGTDTPSAPTYANPPGLNGWLEMHELVEAGMTPVQVFRAATLANAQALHLPEVGTVAAGKRANLLLLTQDPTQTIEAYDHIVKVILGGQVIDRAALDAQHLPSLAARLRH